MTKKKTVRAVGKWISLTPQDWNAIDIIMSTSKNVLIKNATDAIVAAIHRMANDLKEDKA